MSMTKRLQVLLDDAEYAALQKAAVARGVTVAEWVRRALVSARRLESSGDLDRKLDAIRTAVRHTGPSGPIERMTDEIDRGYGGGSWAVVFVDSSVVMYLVGAAHPNKVDAQRRLEQLVADRVRLVTDAEVMNEILHRYVVLERRGYIQAALDALLGVVDEVWPVDRAVMERAKAVTLQYPGLPVRVAVHLAGMQLRGVEQVLSFDAGFERVPGVVRLR